MWHSGGSVQNEQYFYVNMPKYDRKVNKEECLKRTSGVNRIWVSRHVLKGAEVYLTQGGAC